MIRLIAVNLQRRRTRTLLTAMGIAIGVAAIVAMLSLTARLQKSAGELMRLGKPDLALFQRDITDPTASALPETLVPRVRAQRSVVAASPIQLVTGALVRESSFIVFGLKPNEFVVRRAVLTGGRRARDGELMLGDIAARRMKLSVGDSLRLRGKKFPIVGTYHSGVTFEDSGSIVTLKTAQRLAQQPHQVTMIAVAVAAGFKTETVIRILDRAFPGTVALVEPNKLGRADTNSLLVKKAAVVIAVLALLIGGIAVTNTMMMAVLERQWELGVLAAVGWSPRRIGALIFGEGVGVSVIGALLGLGLGIFSGEVIVRALSASEFVAPEITGWGLGAGLVIGIAIGVLGGLYPAWRVTRLHPAEVLAQR